MILFNENTNMTFYSNFVSENGGAIDSFDRSSSITFNKNSLVSCKGNKATYGGAVYSARYSVISFNAQSTVTFEYNNASDRGGAQNNCYIIFNADSSVTFKDNIATIGGAL